MKPFDDDGREVDAIFSVTADDNGIKIILESRGGARDGPVPPRNEQYAVAFELLVRRLGQFGATLIDIEVFSRKTEKLPLKARRLNLLSHSLPLALNTLSDVRRFRLDVAGASQRLGRDPQKLTGGNPTKRLRFSVDWPAAIGLSGGALEEMLADARRPANRADEKSIYAPLGRYVASQTTPEFRLSLTEIATILGSPLRDDARTPQFWANARGYDRARRGQWLENGYEAFFEPRTATVRFVRRETISDSPTSDPEELNRRVAALRRRSAQAAPGSSAPPPGHTEVLKATATVTRYSRDPKVIAWVLAHAEGKCEVCDERAPFITDAGDSFLEVHHIRPLGEGGPDQVENAVAACPNCHRQLHFGRQRTELRARTISKIVRLKDFPPVVDQSSNTVPEDVLD